MENIVEALKKLKTEILYDPTIPLLCIYSEKNIIPRDICTLMFIASLFTMTRMRKQLKCPSTEEWKKKSWHMYTVEYCSVIERKCVIGRYVDGPRDCHTEWVRKKNRQYISACMWTLEKWYKWIYLQSRNTDADTENKHRDVSGEREVAWIGRLRLTCILTCRWYCV